MIGGRRRARAPAAAALIASSIALACGSRDEPRGSTPDEPQGEGSRIWEVLTDPDSIDALCRVAGVSVSGQGTPDDCDQVVEQCRNVASVFGGIGAGPAPDLDLEPLLGCSVTASQLDACLAQVLERGIELYGAEVTCGAEALPEVDPASLALAPACLAVVLRCPDLLETML